MQTLCQEAKAYNSENLVYYLGKFTANKVDFAWFLALILGWMPRIFDGLGAHVV